MSKFLPIALLSVLLAGCGGDPDQAPESATTGAELDAAEADSRPVAAMAEPKMSPAAADGPDRSDPNWKRKLDAPSLMAFEPGQEYFWVLSTNLGTMRFRLFPDTAPMHTTSTIYLTRLGFYDDVVFHRVIPGFMAQGGDPTGTGRGGPGYVYGGEFEGGRSHDRAGLLSMANAGPGTDGSQFFITFKPTPHLDGRHTIFGVLVAGKETLDAFEARGSMSGKPTERLVIEKATVEVQ
jgi:peptidyl-prolyl cis-trans isomerase B (cyclophilin B)